MDCVVCIFQFSVHVALNLLWLVNLLVITSNKQVLVLSACGI